MNKKTTDLDELVASGVTNDDLLIIVDVSDTSVSPSGKTKKIKRGSLVPAVSASTTVNIYPIDCTNNPLYPEANVGDRFYVTGAGKIGGVSGVTVHIDDEIVCKGNPDSSTGGTHAAVGNEYYILLGRNATVTGSTSGASTSSIVTYEADVAATYADAVALATGTQKKIISVTATGKKYYYEGVTGVLNDYLTNSPIYDLTPAFTPLANSNYNYDATTGNLTSTINSGSYGGAYTSVEVDYMVIRRVGWFVVGLLSDGSMVMVSAANGNMTTISPSGALGGQIGLFSGAIPASATQVKYSYTNGDLTISYRNELLTTAWTVWGTVTAATLASSGFAIASQKMGNWNNEGIFILEYRIKSNSQVVLVGDRKEYPVASDIQSRLYPFYNKAVTVFGDSMTNEFGVAAGTYTDKLKSKLKLRKISKRGFSGYAIGTPDAGSTLANSSVLDAIISDYSDLIIIWCGVNDFLHNTPLGNAITPSTESVTTTVGGLNYILNYLKTNSPLAQIVFCTPIPCAAPNQDVANTQSHILKDYVDAIKAVCEYYSVPVVDFFSRSNFSFKVPAIMNLYSQEGLHPNDLGFEKLTSLQAKAINNLI